MSLPIAITDFLHGHAVEWERLEFEKSWNPVDVLSTLCAFSNDVHNLGGSCVVVVDVEDSDDQPVLPQAGITQQEADRVQREVLNLGNSAIRPPYHPVAAPHTSDGKLVLVLWAAGGRARPYRARVSMSKDKTEEAWFVCTNSNTLRVRAADGTELMGLASSVPLDDRENIHAKVDDQSRDLARREEARVQRLEVQGRGAVRVTRATTTSFDLRRDRATRHGAEDRS